MTARFAANHRGHEAAMRAGVARAPIERCAIRHSESPGCTRTTPAAGLVGAGAAGGSVGSWGAGRAPDVDAPAALATAGGLMAAAVAAPAPVARMPTPAAPTAMRRSAAGRVTRARRSPIRPTDPAPCATTAAVRPTPSRTSS